MATPQTNKDNPLVTFAPQGNVYDHPLSQYYATYMEVAALRGKLASAQAELERRAKALCEHFSDDDGRPWGSTIVAFVGPQTMLACKVKEGWYEFSNPSQAIEVDEVTSLRAVERSQADIRQSSPLAEGPEPTDD